MDRVDYRRLREGLCPVHATPLERRADYGWCDACNSGWSLAPDAITLRFEVDASHFQEAASRFIRTGPTQVRFSFGPEGGGAA